MTENEIRYAIRYLSPGVWAVSYGDEAVGTAPHPSHACTLAYEHARVEGHPFGANITYADGTVSQPTLFRDAIYVMLPEEHGGA